MINGSEIDNFLELARQAVKINDTDAIIKYYTKVLESNPNNWECIFNLAKAKLERTHFLAIDNEVQIKSFIDESKRALSFVNEEDKEKAVTTIGFMSEAFAFEQLRKIDEMCNSEEYKFQTSIKPMELLAKLCVLNVFRELGDAIEDIINDSKYTEKCSVILWQDFIEEGVKLDWTYKSSEDQKNSFENMMVIYENKIKSFIPTFSKPKNNIEKKDTEKKSGACYVATCVYGSYDCPEVWTLRRFRDKTLQSSWYGRTFIKIYYAISPVIVKAFGDTDWFKEMWRRFLDKKVKKLSKLGYESAPYEDEN